MSKAAAMISCVEVDFVCIIAMACLAHKAVGVGFDRPIKNKMFERALWFAVAACVMEVIWDIHAGGYITLRQGVGWLVNAAYFMCLELSAFAWFIYAEVVENKNILHNRRRFLLSSIPQWVLAALLRRRPSTAGYSPWMRRARITGGRCFLCSFCVPTAMWSTRWQGACRSCCCGKTHRAGGNT